jgi:hypothetical protein
MSVDDVCELDSTVRGSLQVRQHSAFTSASYYVFISGVDSLGWVRWVNDHSLLGLVVGHKIRIVVATSLPFLVLVFRLAIWNKFRRHTHGNRLNMHVSCVLGLQSRRISMQVCVAGVGDKNSYSDDSRGSWTCE